jgi:hypothetical protein
MYIPTVRHRFRGGSTREIQQLVIILLSGINNELSLEGYTYSRQFSFLLLIFSIKDTRRITA